MVLLFSNPLSCLMTKSFRSSINSNRNLLASCRLIGKSTSSNIRSWSSRGSLARLPSLSGPPREEEDFCSLACRDLVTSHHQSCLWQGTLAVLMILIFGSTRNSATILRWPGLVGSSSLKGPTRCCKILGNVKRRPSRVSTLPTSCIAGPSRSHPKILDSHSCSSWS